jgi:hypothetical protein
MMKVSNNTFLRCCALLLAVLFLSATAAFAQDKTERTTMSSGFALITIIPPAMTKFLSKKPVK